MTKKLSNEDFEYVACDLCDSSLATPLMYAGINQMEFERGFQIPNSDIKFKIQKCSNCGLVYLNPRLKEDIARTYYTKHLNGIINLNKISPSEKLIYNLYYKLSRNIPLNNKGRLLDVGCGIGRYLSYLKNLGWDVVGVEPEYAMYKIAKNIHGLNVFNGIIEDFLYTAEENKETFDVITLFQTLEHVPSPTSVILACKRLLNKNGILIIGNQPNFNSLDQRLYKKENSALGIPYHLYHFNEETLQKLCKKIGYKVENVKYELFVPTQLSYNFFNVLGEKLNVKLSIKLKLILCMGLFPFLLPMYLIMKYTKTSFTFSVYLRKEK